MSRPASDPFGERKLCKFRAKLNVLGGEFRVQSTDPKLLSLTADAYAGLPKYRLHNRPFRFDVHMALTKHARTWPRGKPPPEPKLSSGAGLISATIDAGNFAMIDVAMSRALISVSPSLLSYHYHARYELIELTFLTLASRAQKLVPLHGACLGVAGAGVLLMGTSGTGKSTLSLHALAGGMQLMSEDSAFVEPKTMQVTGTPNFLYLQNDSLTSLQNEKLREQIRSAPVIRRRSGARKFEFDLRQVRRGLSRMPLKLAATAFLSRRPAGQHSPLRPLEKNEFLRRLQREQPYAAAQDGWVGFARRIVRLPAYELRRTKHPDDAIGSLRDLLDE